MEITQQEKIAVLKRIFKEDIESFGLFMYPHHIKKETPPFHKEIYSLYQSELDRIAIAAPRGHSKSTITDLVYLSWEIVNKRKRFILLVSDTYGQAVLFLDALKAEFEANDRLKALYGDLKTDKWSEGEIVVGDTMVKAVGAGMKVRGLKFQESRPDLIIVDDLENDELVQSKDRRAKLERWYNGALIPSGADSGQACRVVVIGTILHYDALLTKMVDEKQYTEYEKRVYKAIMDGKPLWEDHLTLEQIDTIKKQYTEKGLGFQFYQEYMNDPVSDENRRFPIEKFKYYEQTDFAGYRTFMAIDRAYSLEKTADSTGIVVVSIDTDNKWFIRHAERLKGTEKDLIEKMFDLRSYYNVEKVGVEQKAFQYTLKPALDEEMRKRNDFFVVTELKDGGRNKNMRIEGLVPRFLSGSLLFKKDQVDLIDEMTMFPLAVHDDLSDALAYMADLIDFAPVTHKPKKTYKPMTKYG